MTSTLPVHCLDAREDAVGDAKNRTLRGNKATDLSQVANEACSDHNPDVVMQPCSGKQGEPRTNLLQVHGFSTEVGTADDCNPAWRVSWSQRSVVGHKGAYNHLLQWMTPVLQFEAQPGRQTQSQ